MKVNKNFAIDLVAEEPVTDIQARVVSCDGGGGALGHPKVYINLVSVFCFPSGLIVTHNDTIWQLSVHLDKDSMSLRAMLRSIVSQISLVL